MKGLRAEDDIEQGGSSPPAAVLVTLLAVVLAGVIAVFASGVMVWVGVGALALGAAYFASRSTTPKKSSGDVAKARRLLLLLDRGGVADCKVPADFTNEWATVYERVNKASFDARTGSAALVELEKLRKQIELAVSLLDKDKDPLKEAREFKSSPLEALLSYTHTQDSLAPTPGGPVVSKLTLGEEEELVGSGSDKLPDDWPKPAGASAGYDAPARPAMRTAVGGGISAAAAGGAEIEVGLRDLMRDIEALRITLAGGRAESPRQAEDPAIRTPAQLVDAVVLTAADGIEDLAAGLMRANELASVAERVTNRATLLALNAALEATRSGSEAFAAIAEETRRLAEFAREATDTISRLSSEIEYKVGETITAIHATSEDAKNSLAELSGIAVPVPNAARSARVQVLRLLERCRELLSSLGAPQPAGSEARMGSGSKPSKGANSTQDNVENDSPPADRLPLEGILLIEGLKPGANLES
jgi:hypothetical protein